jgi:hypothetical protein
MRRKAVSFVAEKTACSISVVRKPQTIWTRSLPDVR